MLQGQRYVCIKKKKEELAAFCMCIHVCLVRAKTHRGPNNGLAVTKQHWHAERFSNHSSYKNTVRIISTLRSAAERALYLFIRNTFGRSHFGFVVVVQRDQTSSSQPPNPTSSNGYANTQNLIQFSGLNYIYQRASSRACSSILITNSRPASSLYLLPTAGKVSCPSV